MRFFTQLGEIENDGLTLFEHFSQYAFSVNTIPCSNAFIERIFSTVSFIKTKIRNRMSITVLGSILLLKYYLQAGFAPTTGKNRKEIRENSSRSSF